MSGKICRVAVVCAAILCDLITTLRAEEGAELYYHSRYLLAGFLVRSSAVCDADPKGAIAAGFGLLGSSELRSISKAYPKKTAGWLGEGASMFNSGVMHDA
jgi:hypothetical protein